MAAREGWSVRTLPRGDGRRVKVPAYQWRDGYQPQSSDLTPQVAQRALEALRKKLGLITPERVLEAARPERAVLHAAFEWDDSVAAERYRLAQAGYLIRAVVCIPDNTDLPSTRNFVYVTDDQGDRGYTDVFTAMGDSELQDQVLEHAWAELKAWQRKYKELEQFAAVFDAIEESKALVKA